MSNWVGYACSFAPYGQMQWRLPLGIQIPWGVIMFIGLATFMPGKPHLCHRPCLDSRPNSSAGSPRQLIRSGKVDDARIQFRRIRRELSDHDLGIEFAHMKAQIEFEMAREVKTLKEVFKLFRHRALVSIAVQTMTSLTGVRARSLN